MKKLKVMAILKMLILTVAILNQAKAQTPDDMCTFFYKNYAGITIRVDATNKTDPNENLAVRLWLNCTDGANIVHIEYLNITVYGFIGGEQKISLNDTSIFKDELLCFNQTSEYEITVHVPSNVWGAAYAEFILRYSIQEDSFQKTEGFSITVIRNVEFEGLKDAYKELNDTFTQLNQTYWELMENYTELEGKLGELNNTRVAVGVLAIIAFFFVITTLYLAMRKPKQYW
ncbi:MAG: hypothetical protein ACP5LB_03100 [Candidatus Bathyarchaeia archaeon]